MEMEREKSGRREREIERGGGRKRLKPKRRK